MLFQRDRRPRWERCFAWFPVRLCFFVPFNDGRVSAWKLGTRVVWLRWVERILCLPNYEGSDFHRLPRKNRPKEQG
jgi:hypothetical protein